MSSSSNLPIDDLSGAPALMPRRAMLLALGAALGTALGTMLLAGLSQPALASKDLLAGLQRWGSGEFRRFGLLVYEATLWAGDDPQRPPLALRLDYKRNIPGKTIAEASVKEMRRFVSDESLLRLWGEQMQRIFPDVQPGDHLLGVYHPDGVRFYQGDRLLGVIGLPGFADAFFAIWLDARSSAPELRQALLRRPGG